MRFTRRRPSIDDFSTAQLEQLVDAYEEIRSRLREIKAVTNVRLPRTTDRRERLAALRALDARAQLTIRITERGNLSVRALVSPRVGQRNTYAVVIRSPAMQR